MATPSLGIQNFFSTTLSGTITASDTTIYLNSVPTPDEGYLVIDLDNSSKEIIYYTSKGANYVTCPSAAAGRGVGVTSAVGHSSGASVRMTVVGEYWEAIQDGTAFDTGSIGAAAYADGWTPVAGTTPNTVTYNGNRSYDLVFNSTNLTTYIGVGDRIRTTRNTSAPTQCTDLESGSSQYYSKTSPTAISFTDDYTVSAWVKMESYHAGGIMARRNADTEGWSLSVNATGTLQLTSLRIAGNNSVTVTYQSLPLGRWVHVAGTADLSGTTTTMYIDGIAVPAATTVTGTCTALVQGTTALVVGAEKSAGTNPFDGKIAQAAVFNAVLSAATIRSYASQGLSGSETSLISAYSFNNSINDLNANANNLTAQGSAVATNADSPFGGQDDGTISATKDYGIVTKTAFSTNTTLTVQVPEGCTIPTSGTVSAFAYSHNKHPYGFPVQTGRWAVQQLLRTAVSQSSPTNGNWHHPNGATKLNIPIGDWSVTYEASMSCSSGTSSTTASSTLSTGTSSESDSFWTVRAGGSGPTNLTSYFGVHRTGELSLSAATDYYLLLRPSNTNVDSIGFGGDQGAALIRVIPGTL